MDIQKRHIFLEKVILKKEDILLDYVSFHPKKNRSVKQIKEMWTNFIQVHNGVKKVQFYLHIPYCSRICKYCMYNTILLKNPKDVDKYIDTLKTYFETFKDVFKNTIFHGLYVWWGTPSILNTAQMQDLFSSLFNNFSFSDEHYKTIEMNPSSSSFEKIDTLKTLWFSRISFWVQSFDKKTLQIEDRTYVSPKKIWELVGYAKKVWFDDINTDIIFWLNDEKYEHMLSNLEKMKVIEPYSITLYTILKDMHRSTIFQENQEEFYKNIQNIYSKVLAQSKILENYTQDEWSNVLWMTLYHKSRPPQKWWYEAHSTSDTSLFWVWDRAFSKIWWIGTYENSDFSASSHAYEESSFKEEMYKYVLQAFQYEIDAQLFFDNFWVEIEQYFWEELKYFVQIWILKFYDNKYIYIWNPKLIGYYWILFLDKEYLLRFLFYRKLISPQVYGI